MQELALVSARVAVRGQLGKGLVSAKAEPDKDYQKLLAKATNFV